MHQRFASEVETPEDERTVTDLMIDQIEFADVIIMNKVGLALSPTRSPQNRSRSISTKRFIGQSLTILIDRHGRRQNPDSNPGSYQDPESWLQDPRDFSATIQAV